MGSKEHKRKKEHKSRHKRKHKRSDSEDRSPDAKKSKKDKEHKSKKHHKRHKHESEKRRKSPSLEASDKEIVEEISVEEEEVYVSREPEQPPAPPAAPEPVVVEEGKSVESLSIEETNRIRAKLGLKPLDTGNSTSENGEKKKEEFVHAPAEDLWKKKKETELREKIQARKDKRNLEKKYSKVKTLGEESDDESASNWVQKSRKQETIIKKEKELAAVGDEFGLGDLVKNEFKEKGKTYNERDLKGLNVEHSLESFKEGQSAVLVIKDKDILDSDNEDVLHSVVVQDKEKAKKNLDVKRRGIGYRAYEDEEIDDYGFFKARVVLSKYDEEIEGEQTTSFTIGERGHIDTSWEQQKESMKQEIRAKGESLSLPPLRLASEYLTKDEMQFKKRKRKVKKTRKREMLKADDLLPLPGDVAGQDHGSRSTATTSNHIEDEDRNIFDENDAADELQRALEKTRKAKLKKTTANEDEGAMKVAQHIETMSQLKIEKPDEQFSTTISLNATDEFCRQLGAQVQSKEPVAVPEHSGEMDMDLDEDDDDEEESTQWSSVVPGQEPPDKKQIKHETEDHAPIEAEPLANAGLLGALKLAQHKGYLQPESKKGGSTVITNATSHLQAQHYSIEDKNAVDYLDKYAHEKYTKDRGRHDRGMITEFSEKRDYKPKVAIEYVDDRGRVLTAKEAFRKLSHRFHGKGSGKTKQEKRQKKLQEEETMKHMSSTDTPLNTVAMMKSKLKTEASPYIVLSGAGKTLMSGGDSLSKK